MRARWALAVLVGWVAAGGGGGCGAGGDGSAYVLMDEEARQAGVELRIDGRPEAASLPVEIPDPTTSVEVRAGAGWARVDLEGGALVWIKGAGAAQRRLGLGRDVKVDGIYVAADESFARRFAGALGATAPVAEAGGMWAIEGEQALVRSAWMSAPPEIAEAEPMLTAAGQAAAAAATGAGAAAPLGAMLRRMAGAPASGGAIGAPSPEAAGGAGDVELLGLYVSLAGAGQRSLLLDADGGFRWDEGWVGRCGDRMLRVGRYRREGDRLWLDPLKVALTIRPDGSLEHDGQVLAAGSGS